MVKYKNNELEESLQNASARAKAELKNYIYDLISLVIVVAIVMASLDALGFLDFENGFWNEFSNFLVTWLPYFMAAVLLNNTLYQKGVFVGKNTIKYISVAKSYSVVINKLNGKQIEGLDEFCDKYNDDTLESIQTQILKREGISYERFSEDSEIIKDDTKVIRKSLLTCTDAELAEQGLTERQINAVNKARDVEIKGISSNILLSSIDVKDRTNLGPTEKQMARRETIVSTLKFMVSTLCMSFIVIKDIRAWGWSSLIIVLFKVAYVFAKCYMSYFKGYNNVTVDLVSHISRKTDILKMYLKYEPELEPEEIEENEVNINT